MKTLCIVNPTAGKGRALKVWQSVEHSIRELCKPLEVAYTRCKGDATCIAKMAADEGFQMVVAFGGDGTFHEVINGLAYSEVIFAIVPAGSGNDFARSLGLSKNPNQAIAAIAAQRVRKIDLGKLADQYFLNMGGLGFDADVASRINRKRILRGPLAYLVAVLQTLIVYRSYQLEIVIDEKKFTEDAVLVSVGNGQYIGGGLRVLPGASLDDGLLDVMVARKCSRWEILKTLPLIYHGKHVGHPKCDFYKGCKIEISLVDRTAKANAQVDGEEFCESNLQFLIAPLALQVIVP